MRSVRTLAVAAATCVGLLAPAAASGAPLQFFTESAQPALDTFGATPSIPLVGDFDGDGASDVFFYRAGSAPEQLVLGNASRTSFAYATGSSINVKGTYRPLTGDFDGDGTSDIFWYAPGKASDTLWLANGGSGFTSYPMSVNGTYKPFVGDFTSNDGHVADDIFWYAPGSAADTIWRGGNGAQFTSIPQKVTGVYTPIVGAFTPDPATGGSTDSTLDVFWYAPGPTADTLWRGDGTGHFSPKAYNVGGTYKPFVGFFDGYGVQDIFWYSSAGNDSVWLADPDTKAFTPHAATIGSGFTPITDEFTIPDEPILWWSPTGVDQFWLPEGEPGTWDHSELSNNTDMGAGYRPLTGDFDGDGHNDIYWLRPGAGAERMFWGPNPDS